MKPDSAITSRIGVPTGTVTVRGCGTSPPTVTSLSTTGRPSAASAMLQSVATLLTTQPTSAGSLALGTTRPVTSWMMDFSSPEG